MVKRTTSSSDVPLAAAGEKAQPTPLKDHPLVFLVGACCATAVATWTLSEMFRVAPIQSQLERQLSKTASSPVIEDITTTTDKSNGSEVVHSAIKFKDAEGDAAYVNYIVRQTDAKRIEVTSSSIKSSKAQQVIGAVYTAEWKCSSGKYEVHLTVLITDFAGNVSLPKNYSIYCRG
ncbi:hypothetical protein [Ensifer aridi]|uniref:hypothetical protein n=1 Tax=Ensifer aridi TaxID=1708715 RepID=UPI00111178FE|nr:hypothetical protein [Ensifer aridi]